MITRVRLKNWKSHLDSDLKFSSGVNVLIGVMGSGKSSIVEAISFALFGTFPGLKSRRLELDHLIMKKPEQKSHCQVELEFAADGRNYYIRRVVHKGRGTGHAEIRRDGELLNVNARGVTDEVVRALQMDYDLFSKAVYSEQNGLDYFLRIPGGKRKGEIDRMLKVDRFEKARAEAVSLRGKVRSRNEERARVLSDLEKEDIAGRLEQANKELGGLKKEQAGLEVEMLKAKRYYEAVSKQITKAEKAEKGLNEARVALEGANAGLEETNESIGRLRKKFLGKDLAGIKAVIAETKRGIGEMAEKISSSEAEIEKRRSELASVNSMIKITREGLEGLEKAGSRCQVCDSEITAEKRKELVARRNDEEKTLMARAKAIAEQLGKAAGERDGLDEKKRGMEIEMERLKTVMVEMGDIEDMQRRRLDYEKHIREIKGRLERLERGLKEAGLDGLRKKGQDLAAKESGLRERISGIRERMSDKQAIIADLGKRKAMMDRYRIGAERDAKIVEDLSSFEKVLKATQDQLREEFLKTVNSIMADVWEELYPYADFQDIRLAIEDDYLLQLKEPGGWVSVEGTISGGERSMATLTLRVAFSMAFLPNLRWLMLDEPTHNLDANAIRQLASVLRDKMGLFADQVFLITHEERITEGVTGSLYRMERDKDSGGPTKIVPL